MNIKVIKDSNGKKILVTEGVYLVTKYMPEKIQNRIFKKYLKINPMNQVYFLKK